MSTWTKAKVVIGIVVVLLLIIGYMILSAPKVQQKISHTMSSSIGLNRAIQLYSYDGKLIKEWKGRTNIEVGETGGARFFDSNNRAILVQGGIIVAEEQ